MPGMHVRNQSLQRVLGAVRGEMRDLRFERADEIRGRIDDGATEREDCIGIIAQRSRKPRRFRIETDAEQRVVALPDLRE